MALKRSLGSKFLLSIGGVATIAAGLFFILVFRQTEGAIMDYVNHQSAAIIGACDAEETGGQTARPEGGGGLFAGL